MPDHMKLHGKEHFTVASDKVVHVQVGTQGTQPVLSVYQSHIEVKNKPLLGITNSEEPTSAVTRGYVDHRLSFAIGPQGVSTVGPQGVCGTGLRGEVGAQGRDGERGFLGSQGRDGTRGVRGVQGLSGGPGFQGNAGLSGAQGYGAQGLHGHCGERGDRGKRGTQGVFGMRGYQGPRAESGPQGDMGPGCEGPQGLIGVSGFQGCQGIAMLGPQGLCGARSQSTTFLSWASVQPVTVTTLANGVAGLPAFVGPGGGANGLGPLDADSHVDLTGGTGLLLNVAGTVPRDCFIVGLHLYFGSVVNLDLRETTLSLKGHIYTSATPNHFFAPLSVSGVMLVSENVQTGDSADVLVPLSTPVFVPARSRIMAVFSATAVGRALVQSLSGYASVSIEFQ